MYRAMELDYLRELNKKVEEHPEVIDPEIVDFEAQPIPSFPVYVEDPSLSMPAKNTIGVGAKLLSFLAPIAVQILLLYGMFFFFGGMSRPLGSNAHPAIAYILLIVQIIALFRSKRIYRFVYKFFQDSTFKKRESVRTQKQRASWMAYDQEKQRFNEQANHLRELNTSMITRRNSALQLRQSFESDIQNALPSPEQWATEETFDCVNSVIDVLNNVRSNPSIVRSGLPQLVDYQYTDPSLFPDTAIEMKKALIKMRNDSVEED